MNAIKQSVVSWWVTGLLCLGLLCLTPSSVLAAPTTTGFVSPVEIQNDITVTNLAELDFGIITSPTSGVQNFNIFDTATVLTTDVTGTGSGGTFVSGQAFGNVDVISPSADNVFIVTTISFPGTCSAGTGTGTAPVLSIVFFVNAAFNSPIDANNSGNGVSSFIAGTLTVDTSARGSWTCAFNVVALFQ